MEDTKRKQADIESTDPDDFSDAEGEGTVTTRPEKKREPQKPPGEKDTIPQIESIDDDYRDDA